MREEKKFRVWRTEGGEYALDCAASASDIERVQAYYRTREDADEARAEMERRDKLEVMVEARADIFLAHTYQTYGNESYVYAKEYLARLGKNEDAGRCEE